MSGVEGSEGGKKTLVALVLPALCAGPTDDDWPEFLAPGVATALDWQKIGRTSTSAEGHGALNGVPEGVMSELVGRVASAGEQLGLACTCERDARRWLTQRQRLEIGWQMAARALAEMTGYFSLSAAHGVANATLRSLLLAGPAADVINAKYPSAQGFDAFSTKREAWLPINAKLASVLKLAADAVDKSSVKQLADTVQYLVHDERWIKLTERRDTDFHRWRPQSVPGGVQPVNPWDHADGFASLTFYGESQYTPPDAYEMVAEASAGRSALAEAMSAWLENWPQALRDLGVPVYKT